MPHSTFLVFRNVLTTIILFCKGKLLVTTGEQAKEKLVKRTEVLDLESSDNMCYDLPPYPNELIGSTGGLPHKRYPIICGGTSITYICPWTNKDCYILTKKG